MTTHSQQVKIVVTYYGIGVHSLRLAMNASSEVTTIQPAWNHADRSASELSR
jgi:hypothetical protein